MNEYVFLQDEFQKDESPLEDPESREVPEELEETACEDSEKDNGSNACKKRGSKQSGKRTVAKKDIPADLTTMLSIPKQIKRKKCNRNKKKITQPGWK